MNHHQITIPLAGYLREWLVAQYGDPVRFPSRSFENAILARYLSKRPGRTSLSPGCEVLSIALPKVRGKEADCYRHLSAEGIAALTEAIDVVFRLDMWHSLAAILTQDNINERIRLWCKEKGIDDDHVEAVRQKFYRARRDYARHGIILGKKYKSSR